MCDANGTARDVHVCGEAPPRRVEVEIHLDQAGQVHTAVFYPPLPACEMQCLGHGLSDSFQPISCGVPPCGPAEEVAALQALENLGGQVAPLPLRRLRELYLHASFVAEHAANFVSSFGPEDGETEKVPKEAVGRSTAPMFRFRRPTSNQMLVHRMGNELIACCRRQLRDGGWSEKIRLRSEVDDCWWHEQRTLGGQALAFARCARDLFHESVLADSPFVQLIRGDCYAPRWYSVGLGDEEGNLRFCGDTLVAVDPDGQVVARVSPADFDARFQVHHDPQLAADFMCVSPPGWHGLCADGRSGLYTSSPAARLNCAVSIDTPEAEAERKRYFETLGGKPVHHTLAIHWARLIEMLYAAERWLQLCDGDGSRIHQNFGGGNEGSRIRQNLAERECGRQPKSGDFGCKRKAVAFVEGPSGLVVHRCEADEGGNVLNSQVLFGPQHNNAAISLCVAKAVRPLVKQGEVAPGLLTNVELAIREYDADPAGCGNHATGTMPLQVTLLDAQGTQLRRFSQNLF
jgi:F420-non-reducing hydrogenase large subunit